MKKILIILIPLVLIGVVFGLGKMGIIPIPGLSPKKADWQAKLKTIYAAKGSFVGDTVTLKDGTPEELKDFLASSKTGKLEPTQTGSNTFKSKKLIDWLIKEAGAKETPKANTAVAQKPTPPKKPEPPKATVDVKAGDAKLATLWEEMGPDKLAPVVEKWKDADLARILAKMDEAVVAELLGKMKPDRASKLSIAIQKEASIVPPPATPNI